MRIKRFFGLGIAVLFILQLCGCSLFTVDTEELLSPPDLTGDLYPIAQALQKSVSNDYTLKYPAKGNYRSAVILNDIDSDGVFEAFAFYSITDGETVSMYINVICREGEKWVSVSQQKIVAGGVDKVEFSDLDGDGVDEILVGWQIYGTSEMQLAVYSFTGGTLSQRMLQRYSFFLCCDLNEDGENEIFLINFLPADTVCSAGIYQLKSDGVTEIAGCSMDGTVKTMSEPRLSELTSGKPAIYVDSVKGAGAITEVLFIEKNELKNPLYDPERKETIITLHPASMSSFDINLDGILEIPIQVEVPSVGKTDGNEILYLTEWCSYNGEVLTPKLTALMNYYDGYYITISEKWMGRIAVQRDIDNRTRQIYAYSTDAAKIGEKLYYIQAVDVAEWDAGKYGNLGLKEFCRYGKTSIVGWVSDYAKNADLTFEELTAAIHPIE